MLQVSKEEVYSKVWPTKNVTIQETEEKDAHVSMTQIAKVTLA
jgi:hypothetical protein